MEIRKFVTLKELPSYYHFISIGSLRHLITRNQDDISQCIVKFGGRQLVDLELFQTWLQNQKLNGKKKDE